MVRTARARAAVALIRTCEREKGRAARGQHMVARVNVIFTTKRIVPQGEV